MAGHSKFKNIMHRKNHQDSKRAKVFTKLAREITVAVKIGSDDQNSNPRLRTAILAARAANMPKDNIERAIQKGMGNEITSNFEEIRYEGYGPAGVSVIVEALTDNRNRTAAEIRAIFNKAGGNLAEVGSVSFMFEHCGVIGYGQTTLQPLGLDFDKMFEASIEAGAENVIAEDEQVIIFTKHDNLNQVREKLHTVLNQFTNGKAPDPNLCQLMWEPTVAKEVADEDAPAVIKFIDALEDNDDVQKVFANYKPSKELAD